MSDSMTAENNQDTPSVVKKTRAQGVCYSLNEMLGEVAEARKLHTRRELLDANEIGKMFADKRHIKRTIK
jgi:hypothetical protein